jgi:hypothetical protein
LPGLRWFDRDRTACTFPDYSRSYVGYQMSAVNRDVDASAPTIFELTGTSLGALSVITRGLPPRQRIGSITPRSALRAARTHFSGDLAGWLEIDRIAADQLARRVRVEQPDFAFGALTGVDKVSHARGQGSPLRSMPSASSTKPRLDSRRCRAKRPLGRHAPVDRERSRPLA